MFSLKHKLHVFADALHVVRCKIKRKQIEYFCCFARNQGFIVCAWHGQFAVVYFRHFWWNRISH